MAEIKKKNADGKSCSTRCPRPPPKKFLDRPLNHPVYYRTIVLNVKVTDNFL